MSMLVLSACGPTTDKPNDKDNYYDERNFIVSNEKVVSESKLVLYDGPQFMDSSSKVNVKIENREAFVYETRVNHGRKFTFAYSEATNPVVVFDFEGRIHIDIQVNNVDSIQSAKISPLVYGIAPTIKGNTISFDLEYNDNYVVEYNDDSENVIHLFANPLEENPLTQADADKDDSIIYIGPGVYESGAIPVKSNSTIYLAGGAYVYGQIRAEGFENIKIRGRGIISGAIFDRTGDNEYTIPVELRTCKNVLLEGLTFLDPAGWCIALYKSENITIENIKIITARGNGDGISVQSCKDVTVKGGFVRTWDDSLVVKNVDRGSTSNVTFDGVNVWTDLAQSMEVGYETYGPTMDNITFKNITVIHNFHKPAISLHNCDDAHITNVHYENITIEDGQMLGDVRDDGENDFFIDMTIAYSPEWTNSSGERGSVEGVTISDVKIYSIAETIVSRINGESNNSAIKDVTIRDIDYAGKAINNEKDLDLIKNNYVSNVQIQKTKALNDILGAIKTLPYRLDLTNNHVTVEVKENIQQEGLLVPEFAFLKGDATFIGSKLDTSTYVSNSSHGTGIKPTSPSDDGSGKFVASGHDAQLAFDGDSNTYYETDTWKNEEDEFAAISIEFGDDTHQIGVVRVKGVTTNEFKYTYSISVFAIKANGEKYVRVLNTNKYTLSPANGNVIDINISTQEYRAIQLRLFNQPGMTSPSSYKIAEIELYAPSLSFGKAIVDSTEHNDVYPVNNIVDGQVDGTSYYESKTLPAHIVIDLEDVYDLQVMLLSLNPSLMWDARIQNIEVLVSSDNRAYDNNISFTTVFEAQDYLFDPQTGNRVMLNFAEGTQARYIKLIINSNSAAGGYGAQLAEVSVYGK